MKRIELLDSETIDKIAAGEIVERPSSVVKELVENAIDAGASAITIEIERGGIDLIRVTDNGCGIEADQIEAAFCRHATSKIRTAKDLESVASLGFRGEALSSIAAVAQVEMITKTADGIAGCRCVIEGGSAPVLEEVGAPDGTTILVRNLFYNTPARRKFLGSAQTEAGHIAALAGQLAMSRPDISLCFIHKGQVRLHTNGSGRLKDVLYAIYGRELTANLLPVAYACEGFSVTGYIGKPAISRGNRSYEQYFINGRLIAADLIVKATEDAYKGFLMQHRYPFTALHFTIPTHRIDVNVHPGKVKLRFLEPEGIYEELSAVLRDVLNKGELIPAVSVGSGGKEDGKETAAIEDGKESQAKGNGKESQAIGDGKESAKKSPRQHSERPAEPFEKKQLAKIRAGIRQDSPYEYKYPHRMGEDRTSSAEDRPDASVGPVYTSDRMSSSPAAPAYTADRMPSSPAANAASADRALGAVSFAQDGPADAVSSVQDAPKSLPFLAEDSRSCYRLIGQVFDTYWLIEYGENLYIIDQHAAHEKVLYERVMRSYREHSFHAQQIRPPIVLQLTLREETLISHYASYFADLGFEIEDFGSGSIVVRALPADLYGLNGREVLMDLIDQLDEPGHADAPQLVLEKLASMSCKAAVKGSRRLSVPEMEALIDELLQLDNPYFCPHGRPVIISIGRRELDKKFKRIV